MISVCCYFADTWLQPVLVDFPHTATFLTPEERAYVVHRKSRSLVLLRILKLKLNPPPAARVRQFICRRRRAF